MKTPFCICLYSVYQPPEELDPVQPTPEEIEELVKIFQKEAKKSKNPPPMPDFSAPKMIVPPKVLVKGESGRKFKVTICIFVHFFSFKSFEGSS